MQHIALVPLIGGMAIAGETVLGSEPRAVVSYKAFDENDSLYMNWLYKRGHNTERILLDDAPDYTPNFGEIELVTSLCPCSGLTSANPLHGGPEFEQNRWMIKSTNMALGKIKPKVLIGENASRLYSSFGQPVAATLKLIADYHGYHMALYKTDTRYHGIPQTRNRAFFAFYRKDIWKTVPMIKAGPEHHTPFDGSWLDYLDNFEAAPTNQKNWSHNDMLSFVLEKDPEWAQRCNRTSSLYTIIENGWVDEFVEKFPGKSAKNILRCRDKLAAGGGIWDNSPKTPGYYHPSVMYRTMADTVHPRGTSLSPREYMRLMGLPESFDIPEKTNTIAQNVPACTAEWIVRSCLNAKEAELPSFEGDGILRQNNSNGSVSCGLPYGKQFAKHGFVHKDLVPVDEVVQVSLHEAKTVLV